MPTPRPWPKRMGAEPTLTAARRRRQERLQGTGLRAALCQSGALRAALKLLESTPRFLLLHTHAIAGRETPGPLPTDPGPQRPRKRTVGRWTWRERTLHVKSTSMSENNISFWCRGARSFQRPPGSWYHRDDLRIASGQSEGHGSTGGVWRSSVGTPNVARDLGKKHRHFCRMSSYGPGAAKQGGNHGDRAARGGGPRPRAFGNGR